MEKRVYVLTCINEENAIVDQKIFNSHCEAASKMVEQFDRERAAFIADFGEEALFENDVFEESAHLAVGDEPLLYYWYIRSCVVNFD